MAAKGLRMTTATSVRAFISARDFLLNNREDFARATAEFRWPELDEFNWALDYFDTLASDATALCIVNADEPDEQRTFAELAERSNRVANFLRSLGVGRGDRILLVLPNCVPLWETMLAAMKLGAVLIPASTLLTPDDLRDRVDRGEVKAIVAAAELAPRFAGIADAQLKIAVGGQASGWNAYTD